jgi:nucleotide-binding universal stress UspA family protein
MKAIEHLVVPVDFFTHSDLQAGFALAIAATFDARITFVHVMRRVVDYTDFDPATLARLGEKYSAASRPRPSSPLPTSTTPT